MNKKPDNVVFNNKTREYDAFKKTYPTSFNSKNFDIIQNSKELSHEATHYLENRIIEIKDEYNKLINEIEHTRLISSSEYNFTPIIGQIYYLYENKNKKFLSVIGPEEWKMKFLGKFKMTTNKIWTKID